MPDAAFAATERQFVRLATGAAPLPLDIQLFHIPAVPRGNEAKALLAERYRGIDEMLGLAFDGLIVTGNEPRAPRLDEEPYWRDLTSIVDWAKTNTTASLWSCLAAHAAVLHADGIERRRLPQKVSGVLGCTVTDPAALGLPAKLSVCHSRMNELRGCDLQDNGYEIVSQTQDGQVDSFTKTLGSRFHFLQGHPEYDPDSLMREYRRDVGRYLAGTRDLYPDVPESYFDTATVLRMENYRTLAERGRDLRLFESFPAVSLRPGLETGLAAGAQALFGHWLGEFMVPAV
jgi:homoserine O-succinyltransferase